MEELKEQPALMTTQEVATLLRKHPVSLCIDRQKNRSLPFIKLGRRVYYKREDVMAALEAGYHTATAKA